MIEFDVLPARDGRAALLAHDYVDAARREPHTLEEGLAHLAGEAFAAIELDVDLKLPGYELRVLEALRDLRPARPRADLQPVPLEPGADPGGGARRAAGLVGAQAAARSVPLAGAGVPALAVVAAARAALPARAARAIRAGECDALMVHWRLVTPAAGPRGARRRWRALRLDGR